MQIILFINGGGLRPPNPLIVFRPLMYAITKKYHAITVFAAREGCAAYFVRV